MRIGQVGYRPAPFFSVIWNEGELMEKFGIKIVPINFAIIEQKMKSAEVDYAEEIAEYENYFLSNYTLDDLPPQYITPMATMAAMYKHLFEEYNLDVEPKIPMFDIPNVIFYPTFHLPQLPSLPSIPVYLCPTGNARFNKMTKHVFVYNLRIILRMFHHVRTRTNDRHIPHKNIDKLR